MDIEQAKNLIGKKFDGGTSAKIDGYIGKFYARQIKSDTISAKVEGNYGDYTVSLKLDGQQVSFSCSCYIGKHGCHHCAALAHTFLQDSESFEIINEIKRSGIKNLEQLENYLDYVTLSELLDELKSMGISQKEFAEAVGTTSQHLSSIKSSEARNRFYKELGAVKLACLWMIEKAGKLKKRGRSSKKKE